MAGAAPDAEAVDAEALATAVAACPSVVRLTGGSLGAQVATYLPGRRVPGVRVGDDEVEVHLSSLWGVPIPDVAAQVRAAVAPLVHGRAVQVFVDDIEEPALALPEAASPAEALPSATPGGAIDAGEPPPAVASPS